MLQPQSLTLIKELKNIVESLLHISDESAPYEIGAVGKDHDLLLAIRQPDNRPVVEINPENFFKKLIKSHPWLSEDEKHKAERYIRLDEFFRKNLKEVKVMKIGEVCVDVYVIGKTVENDYIILSTSELHLPTYITSDY